MVTRRAVSEAGGNMVKQEHRAHVLCQGVTLVTTSVNMRLSIPPDVVHLVSTWRPDYHVPLRDLKLAHW